MRRIVIATGTTITGLVLLLSYPTSQNRMAAAIGSAGQSGAPSATSAGTSAATATPAPSTAAAGAGPAPKTATFDGSAAGTQFGDVQVRITVTNGVLTAAQAIQYPNGSGHDQQINSYAIPILNQKATAAKSAKINMVSGATYTSGGYLKSLQSALDQAGL